MHHAKKEQKKNVAGKQLVIPESTFETNKNTYYYLIAEFML